jgi:hypothetical protein
VVGQQASFCAVNLRVRVGGYAPHPGFCGVGVRSSSLLDCPGARSGPPRGVPGIYSACVYLPCPVLTHSEHTRTQAILVRTRANENTDAQSHTHTHTLTHSHAPSSSHPDTQNSTPPVYDAETAMPLTFLHTDTLASTDRQTERGRETHARTHTQTSVLSLRTDSWLWTAVHASLSSRASLLLTQDIRIVGYSPECQGP